MPRTASPLARTTFGKRAPITVLRPATVRPAHARALPFDSTVAGIRARAEERALALEWSGSPASVSMRDEMADALHAIDLRRIQSRTIARIAFFAILAAVVVALAVMGAALVRVFVPVAFDPVALDAFAGWTASDVLAAMGSEVRSTFGSLARP